MGIKSLIMILASLSFSVSAFANMHEDGEKKPIKITNDFAGSLNFYGNEFGGGFSPDHDDFNLDLIQVQVEKHWSMSSLVVTIGYGTVADTVNFGATNNSLSLNSLNVMQAYYHMHTSYGLGFTFGKFQSPIGYETYNIMDNSQYNRSYGFSLAPYFQTGIKLDYGNDMYNAAFIVSNGAGRDSDITRAGIADSNKSMAIAIDVDAIENLHIDLNYMTGTEGDAASAWPAFSTHQINTLDFSIAYMFNEMFDAAINYIDYSQTASAPGATTEKATSIAAYVNANFGMFGLGLRYEQFNFDDGVVIRNGLVPAGSLVPPQGSPFTRNAITGEDNSIQSITLAATAEIDQNARVILEYKQDTSDDANVWVDADNAPTDTQNVVTLGLNYRF
jgi:hypothetical protein